MLCLLHYGCKILPELFSVSYLSSQWVYCISGRFVQSITLFPMTRSLYFLFFSECVFKFRYLIWNNSVNYHINKTKEICSIHLYQKPFIDILKYWNNFKFQIFFYALFVLRVLMNQFVMYSSTCVKCYNESNSS
jgi:hypothetical protein